LKSISCAIEAWIPGSAARPRNDEISWCDKFFIPLSQTSPILAPVSSIRERLPESFEGGERPAPPSCGRRNREPGEAVSKGSPMPLRASVPDGALHGPRANSAGRENPVVSWIKKRNGCSFQNAGQGAWLCHSLYFSRQDHAPCFPGLFNDRMLLKQAR
jgi:hypothetical protein